MAFCKLRTGPHLSSLEMPSQTHPKVLLNTVKLKWKMNHYSSKQHVNV